jgi:2-keto-3-deoxy-L-rhamnonate aldolase RhmA
MTDSRNALQAALERLDDSAVKTLLPLVEQVASSKNSVKTAFLLRSVGALNRIAIENTSLTDALAASSDYTMLLEILTLPEALSTLTSSDPLASAKLRGLMVKQQLLEASGGCISSPQAAEMLGISRQAIDKRRRSGKIIGLPSGKNRFVYPVWQFTTGDTLPGLETTLQNLSVRDPWMQIAFMLNGNFRLDGMSPLEALKQGKLKEVIVAAQMYGEQGAA